MKQKPEEERKEVNEMDIRTAWTSTVINTLYDLFKDSAFGGIPFRGISLVTRKDVTGQDVVSVNFVFTQGAKNA